MIKETSRAMKMFAEEVRALWFAISDTFV